LFGDYLFAQGIRNQVESDSSSGWVVWVHDDDQLDKANALLDHLAARKAERQVASPKQLRWIADLAKKAGLDEAGACALVGVSAYEELNGGKGGTASALIDVMRANQKDQAQKS